MRKVITIICMLVMLIVPCWSYSEKTTLVTNWGVYSSLLEEYEKEHPDIQISKDESAEQLYSTLIHYFLTNDSSLDFFFIDSPLGAPKQMREKGFFTDLSSDPDIVDYVNKMNPVIRKCIMKDDKITALPTYLMFEYLFVVNRDIQMEMGLKDEELPDNLLDLLRFANNWHEQYGKKYPDYYPLFNTSAAMYPVEMYNPFWGLVMEKYIDSMLATGQELRFDTPLFHALLDEISPWNASVAGKQDHVIGEADKSLFAVIPISNFFVNDYLGCNCLVSMPVDKGWPDVFGCLIEYAFVNPASKHIPESISAVKTYLEYMTPEMERFMIPTQNDPWQSPDYETDLADLKEYIEKQKKVIENETDQDKKDWYEFDLGVSERMLQEMIDHPYSISPEAIREYREKIEPYLFPIGESKYDSETFYVELLDVMELLGSEGITNDLLIKKLDEMIVKVEMELGI